MPKKKDVPKKKTDAIQEFSACSNRGDVCAIRTSGSTVATAQQCKILHAFRRGKDGCNPNGAALFLMKPVIFMARRQAVWAAVGRGGPERILHNFAAGLLAGLGACHSGKLTLDPAGNLYGAAGVVFEIIP